MPKIFRTATYEANSTALMNYVVGLNDEPINTATVDTVSISSWHYDDESEAEEGVDGTGELILTAVVQDAIFDDLQTGNGWPANRPPGYNLRILLSSSHFPAPGYVRTEITIVPSQTSGEEPFTAAVWIITVKPIRGHEDV